MSEAPTQNSQMNQVMSGQDDLEEKSEGEHHDEEMEPSVDVLSQHGVSE